MAFNANVEPEPFRRGDVVERIVIRKSCSPPPFHLRPLLLPSDTLRHGILAAPGAHFLSHIS